MGGYTTKWIVASPTTRRRHYTFIVLRVGAFFGDKYFRQRRFFSPRHRHFTDEADRWSIAFDRSTINAFYRRRVANTRGVIAAGSAARPTIFFVRYVRHHSKSTFSAFFFNFNGRPQVRPYAWCAPKFATKLWTKGHHYTVQHWRKGTFIDSTSFGEHNRVGLQRRFHRYVNVWPPTKGVFTTKSFDTFRWRGKWAHSHTTWHTDNTYGANAGGGGITIIFRIVPRVSEARRPGVTLLGKG